jgi:hypothetical protein
LKNIALIISYILNPILLFAPVPYILVYRATLNFNLSLFWEFFTLIFIVIFMGFVLAGIKIGYFSDFDVSNRTQRPVAFGFALILSALYIFSLFSLQAPLILFIAIITLFAGLIVMEIVNRFTKASVHVGVVSAFATSLFLVYGGLFSFSFLLIPLLAWARIKTRNHTKQQTIIGAIVGMAIILVSYVIFEYII